MALQADGHREDAMDVKRVPGADRKHLEVALKNLQGKVGKVGWFKGSYYPNGMPVAAVAAIQEKGYEPKNIPPRPFMRPSIIKYEQTWKRVAFEGSKNILEGKSTAYKVMNDIGAVAVKNILHTIKGIYTPALKAATIARRLAKYTNKSKIGNLYKPLNDTGRMMATLINVVEEG